MENESGCFITKRDISVFLSCAGGVGTTSTAIAYALKSVNEGIKTLYIDLSEVSNQVCYLTGGGNKDFSDAILAVKLGGGEMVKRVLESISLSERGLYYIRDARNVIDMTSATDDQLITLVRILREESDFSRIVIDMKNYYRAYQIKLLSEAGEIFVISDGFETTNDKLRKSFLGLSEYERLEGVKLLDKVNVIYNKQSSRMGSQLEGFRKESGIGRFVKTDDMGITEKEFNELILLEIMNRLNDKRVLGYGG